MSNKINKEYKAEGRGMQKEASVRTWVLRPTSVINQARSFGQVVLSF